MLHTYRFHFDSLGENISCRPVRAEAAGYPAIARALRKTSSSIRSVSFPVDVFCWLGW